MYECFTWFIHWHIANHHLLSCIGCRLHGVFFEAKWVETDGLLGLELLLKHGVNLLAL